MDGFRPGWTGRPVRLSKAFGKRVWIMSNRTELKLYLAAPRGFCAGVDRAIKIVEEAIRRFGAPPQIPGVPVMVVAGIGIAVNLGAAWLVRDGHDDLNRRGAFLHLVADAAVSLAAVLAGAGMLAFGWNWLDPLTALLVGAVIAASAFGLLRDAFDASMDAVPRNLDRDRVQGFLLEQAGVVSVHHLHIWSLGAGEIAMTAHMVRSDDGDHDAFIDRLADALDERFGINHPTLQIERGSACGHDRHDRAPHAH